MRTYTEELLLRICQKLQLTPNLYEQATERYETIAKIITKDDAFQKIDLNIYPQGSFRLKTTVKPLSSEEYDLDFVAELPADSAMTPHQLYDHVFRILSSDGIHDKMVEKKKRCIRVNYANDFHMDIMPGKLVNPETHEIVVPDKELKNWYHHSNPIGFAEWFEKQARTQILHEMSEQRAQFQVEKVSEQEVAKRLEPLRRAVQLVKRYRDIYCDKTHREPVRSIVICTLMGRITSFTGDTLQIIASFCTYVNKLIAASHGKAFPVRNPVVDELLTEKWEEGSNYQDFVDMMKELTKDVDELAQYGVNKDINQVVKKMFGETITDSAIKEYAAVLNESRNAGSLSVSSAGTLNTKNSGVSVKNNTFFGG